MSSVQSDLAIPPAAQPHDAILVDQAPYQTSWEQRGKVPAFHTHLCREGGRAGARSGRRRRQQSFLRRRRPAWSSSDMGRQEGKVGVFSYV